MGESKMRKLIALGIMLLFLGMTISSSTGLYLEKQSTIATFDGNTLYVGGNGTGNYTSIQDAIDNASNGDTVYVYDDSSPYYENLKVDKSINLIGEDRMTTAIDGNGVGDVVYVSVNGTRISGFTIQNSGNEWNDSGIEILSRYNNISSNIISNNLLAIFLDSFSSNSVICDNTICSDFIPLYLNYSHNNSISHNSFSDYDYGVALWFYQSDDNIVANNIISSDKEEGIWLFYSSNNTISRNRISTYADDVSYSYSFNNIRKYTSTKTYLSRIQLEDSMWYKPKPAPPPMSIVIIDASNNTISNNHIFGEICLSLGWTSDNIISRNNIVFNRYGISYIFSNNSKIIGNNFFKNNISILGSGYVLLMDEDFSDDIWDQNFWNRPRLLPKPIFGIKGVRIMNKNLLIPWFNFDWHPASEPYDIEV